MKTFLSTIRFAVLAGALAFAGHAAAQTGTTVMTTAPFVFKGQQSAAGAIADGTYFATVSGQAQNTLNNKTRDTVTFTLQYDVANGVGTVVSGTWNLTEMVKDRPPFTTGGAITPSAVVAVFASGGLAPGKLNLNFEAGNASWPVSAVFNGSVDNSRPPKIDNASMLLTYPVVQ